MACREFSSFDAAALTKPLHFYPANKQLHAEEKVNVCLKFRNKFKALTKTSFSSKAGLQNSQINCDRQVKLLTIGD